MKSDEIKLGVCFHEAGHWVVARNLDFKVGEVRIKIIKDGENIGHYGSSKIFPRLNSNPTQFIEKYLKNRIAVLFAGVIAQTLTITNKDANTAEGLLRTDGSDDYKTITELLFILRGVCHPDEAEELDDTQILKLQKECWEHSDKIIQSMRGDIEALAHKMANEIACINKEYIFNHNKLTGWLPNSSLNSDAPPDGGALTCYTPREIAE
ncbi:Peptidase family M41 [Rhodoferax sp. OV413]|nr:Peptidase family M41 [Rhodoferax sp. OV413]